MALIIVFSIGAIHAGDINSTALNSSGDDYLQIDDSASFNGVDSNADHLDESDKNQTEFSGKIGLAQMQFPIGTLWEK